MPGGQPWKGSTDAVARERPVDRPDSSIITVIILVYFQKILFLEEILVLLYAKLGSTCGRRPRKPLPAGNGAGHNAIATARGKVLVR